MATQKPISTISYNTEAFLREKLDSWVEAHKIQSYMYICHKGEDGDKDHIHLRIEPNKRLDPMELTAELREFQKGKDKPLGVRPWRSSKEEDWILYDVHDPQYMQLKYGGGERGEKIEYSWKDIKASEDFDVEVAYIRAKQTLLHTPANLMTRMKNGTNAYSLVQEGENPFIVTNLMRVLHASDYERLAVDFRDVSVRLSKIEEAIERAGFELIEDEHGNLNLVAV